MTYKLADSIKVEDGKTRFLKERLQEIVSGYDLDSCEDFEGAEVAMVIENKVTDTSRWSTYYKCVFKLDDKFYSTEYSEGSTEIQDEEPYEYDGEYVEVTEVVPKEVKVTRYVPKEVA